MNFFLFFLDEVLMKKKEAQEESDLQKKQREKGVVGLGVFEREIGEILNPIKQREGILEK